MLSIAPAELRTVTEALVENPADYGVGVIHLPTGWVGLRPFSDVPHGGGHVALARQFTWSVGDCRGFLLARPAGKAVIVNASHLNLAATGTLQMPPNVFQDLVSALRHCWQALARESLPQPDGEYIE